jgi:L-malate glycosyltransferase
LRVVHLVSGDQWAGAEVMQMHLLTHLAHTPACAPSVICLNEGELSGRLRSAGVAVTVFPESKLSFAQILRRAAGLLAQQRPAVLHSHRYKEHYLAALLAPWLGVRAVATVHGLPEPSRARRVGYELQAAMTFRLLRSRFDRIVAVSAEMRRQLLQRYRLAAGKVEVVINGVPIPAEQGPLRVDSVVHIGSVGRLVRVKRFELFLDVAAALCRQHSNLRFSILGDGPDRDLLIRRAAALGLEDHFQLVESTPNPHSYYASLDLYLNTSAHEGLTLSVLEAMAHRVPVVASAVGGIPEIVRAGRDEGVLIDSADPRDYAAALSTMIADAAARSRVGQRGSDRVRAHFSAEAMAHSYGCLYQQLAGRPVAAVLAPVSMERFK